MATNPVLLLKQKIAANHQLMQEVNDLKEQNKKLALKVKELEKAADLKVNEIGVQTDVKKVKDVSVQTESDSLKIKAANQGQKRLQNEIVENGAKKTEVAPPFPPKPVSKITAENRKFIPFFGAGFGSFRTKKRKKISFNLLGSLSNQLPSPRVTPLPRPPPDVVDSEDLCPINANKADLPETSDKKRGAFVRKGQVQRQAIKAPKMKFKIKTPDTQDYAVSPSSEDDSPPKKRKVENLFSDSDSEMSQGSPQKRLKAKGKGPPVQRKKMFVSGGPLIPLGQVHNKFQLNPERNASSGVNKASLVSLGPAGPTEGPKEPSKITKMKVTPDVRRSAGSKKKFKDTLLLENVIRPERRNAPKSSLPLSSKKPPMVPPAIGSTAPLAIEKPTNDQDIADLSHPKEDLATSLEVRKSKMTPGIEEPLDVSPGLGEPKNRCKEPSETHHVQRSDGSKKKFKDTLLLENVIRPERRNTPKSSLPLSSKKPPIVPPAFGSTATSAIEKPTNDQDIADLSHLKEDLATSLEVRKSKMTPGVEEPPDVSPGLGEPKNRYKEPSETHHVQRSDGSEQKVDDALLTSHSLKEMPAVPPKKSTSPAVSSEVTKTTARKGQDLGDLSHLEEDLELSDDEEVVKSPEDGSNLLEEMVKGYQEELTKKRIELNRRRQKFKSAKYEDKLCHEIALSCVQIQFGRLWKECNEETMNNIVKQLTSEKAVMCNFKRTLVQVGYMAVRDEKSWEEGISEVASWAPMLTAKQSKVLALLIMLEDKSKGQADENSMKDVMDHFLAFISYTIFNKERSNGLKVSQLANLCRFYMAVVRFKGYEVRARMFLYDVLYLRTPRSHVMLSVFFDCWPEVLFWTGTDETVIDPLLETVVWMTHNSGSTTSLVDMKVFDARRKLTDLCGLPNPGSTGQDLVKHLIKRTEENCEDVSFCLSTTRSLSLIARCQEYQWANNHIVRRLLELLGRCWNGNRDPKSEKLLRWVIETIGHVSRVYPAEGRQSLLSIFQPISKMLLDASDLNPDLEDTCIRTLIRTGHHLQLQTSQFLLKWTPRHEMRRETASLIRNYLGTRGRFHSSTTVMVNKKKKIYEALKK